MILLLKLVVRGVINFIHPFWGGFNFCSMEFDESFSTLTAPSPHIEHKLGPIFGAKQIGPSEGQHVWGHKFGSQIWASILCPKWIPKRGANILGLRWTLNRVPNLGFTFGLKSGPTLVTNLGPNLSPQSGSHFSGPQFLWPLFGPCVGSWQGMLLIRICG